MFKWHPNIGDKWYGIPIIVEHDQYIVRSSTNQTINGTKVKMDEIFSVPKLVTLPLDELLNISVSVMVIGQRVIDANKKVWQCRISKHDPPKMRAVN